MVTKYLKGDKDFELCPGFHNKITLAAIENQSAPVDSLQTILEMQQRVQIDKSYEKCPDFWVSFEIEPTYIEFILCQPDFCADRLRFYNPRFNLKSRFDDKIAKNGDDGWFFCRLLP